MHFRLTDDDELHLLKLRVLNKDQHALLVEIKNNPNVSYRDLEAIFQIPPGTVKSRLNRARRFIMRCREDAAKATEATAA